MRNSRPHQLIETSDAAPMHGMRLDDITLDGQPDLVIAEGPCAGNCWSSVWPFHPQSKRFANRPLLSRMANLRVVDPQRKIIESVVCRGQACAVFEAHALAIDEDGTRLVAQATQTDASPGAMTKRLRVMAADGRLICDALVEPTGVSRPTVGDCWGWPLHPAR
jgi:hypothetical protein